MRAFQALVNAASLANRGRKLDGSLISALQFLEGQRPGLVAPPASAAWAGFRMYVPNNQADLVTAAWQRGNTGASIAEYRQPKDVRPMRVQREGEELPAIHYLFSLLGSPLPGPVLLQAVRTAARSVSALGWGIDTVAGDATLIPDSDTAKLSGDHWLPSETSAGLLRVPRPGSLAELQERHAHFLQRLSDGKFTPVPPLTEFDPIGYRPADEPESRLYIAFRLIDANGDSMTYPHRKLIHVAGMVRHAAIEAIGTTPPPSQGPEYASLRLLIAGHAEAGAQRRAQISYIPLPSIGHHHTDPGIRRVLVTAPVDGIEAIEFLADQLDGCQLVAESPSTFPESVFLERITHDPVLSRYLARSDVWASVTPVILPGHDDHRPEKTRNLIARALTQSGIDLDCEFEWQPLPYFNQSLPAFKYDRAGRPTGYYRPNHLEGFTAVHLRIRFKKPIPGPVAIGSGRHCGLGTFAPFPS